jgi:LacI family transcriptional regulator
MKDIARDLGVAVITVSKAIHGHPDISEKTHKRVLDRVKELNYTPNLAARSLVTGRTYLVGLVVPDLLHTFFAQIANALSEALLKRGYGLIISTSGEDPDLERRTLERLLARRLDALVIASASTTPEVLDHVLRQGQAVVLIDRRFPGLEANYVGADDESIGMLATEHLIEIGCRRIAHLRGPETSPAAGRLSGYLKALKKHRVKPSPDLVSAPRPADVKSRESGEALMRQLLELRPRPDGVFAYNDPMAIGAIHAILDRGLRVPEDIAVIGAGNLHYDAELRVPLSSIDQQTDEIGERAARLTIALMEAKKPQRNKTVMIEPRLIVRDSTRRERRAGTNEAKKTPAKAGRVSR